MCMLLTQDTVRPAELLTKVPRHLQEQLTQTLMVKLDKNALGFIYSEIGGGGGRPLFSLIVIRPASLTEL